MDMELKSKIWFGACTICWAIWLCRNEVIFYNALVPTPMQVIFRGTYWMRQWALLIKEDPRAQVGVSPIRDGNGYPKPEYPTGFTRYEGGYGMISLPAGMLMGKNLYPLGRRVRVWVGTTHTRLPVGKIYPHQ